MLEQLKLRCDGYNIKIILKDNQQLINYCAESQNKYLVNDLKVEGIYFRKVVEKVNDQSFLVNYPQGQVLEKLIQENDFLPEKIIQTILIQILEGLAKLYRNKILGRCFNIENIMWDGNNISMMNFGFYPEVCQTLKNYDHSLDTLLLGQVAYCLITCQPKINSNYLETLICPPVSQELKELTAKMLDSENKRIQLWQIAEYFKSNLPEDIYKFYINSYQDNCKILDQIIIEREQYAYCSIKIIQFEPEDQVIQEDMSYLLYYNKQINENQIIWEQLHNELYRIYLLQNLKKIIKDKYQYQEEQTYLDQLNFIVDKTILIVMCKFEKYLQTEFSGDQCFTLRRVLKDQIMNGKSFFNTDHNLENIKNQTKKKKDTEKHFQMDIFENEFDDIKLAFRKYVLDVYRYYEKNAQNCKDPQEKLENSQIQLRILMTIILNQVIKNKEVHFKTLKKVVGKQKLCLNDIEIRFFQLASIQQIQEQITEINQEYFIK
ncbi:unnamed protein product [Paramecium pentaurelia]|uniref:Protein kinase domain-containing protein n=1 Tax=Paramecium pentaurelia TaxID=43138 RepID=A0A8S1WQS2_9CILI|nr:unnamed protein product [Paramecium pentaurelia]